MSKVAEEKQDVRERLKALPYLESVAAIAVITWIQLNGGSYFEQRAYCSPLLIGTSYGVWRGGKGPGIVSLAAGALIAYVALSPPRFSWVFKDARDTLSVVLYVLVGIVIILFGEAHRAQRRRVLEREAELKTAYEQLAEAHASLDELVARRTAELKEIKNFVAEEM